MNIPKLLQQAAGHLNAGNPGAADVVLRKILKKQPKHPDALNLAGVAAYQLEEFDRSRTLLSRVLERDPSHAGAHLNLGAVLNALQDYAAAERHYLAALRAAPGNATALNNLGKNYLDQNKLGEAARWLESAAAADPGYWIALHNLGTVQQRRGEADASIETFHKVLQSHPNPDTLSELIGSLRRTNRFDEEYACAQQLLALPDAGDAAISAWETLFDACDWNAIADTRDRILALLQAPETRAAHRTGGLILLQSIADIDPGLTYECHRAWAASLPRGKTTSHSRPVGSRIRIGYMSPDFRDHSVGFFIRNVIAAHDTARCEIHCYANSPDRDAVTAEIERSAASYVCVHDLSDAELAAVIEDDGIDILIDLAGHTRDSRVALMKDRIAPLQITYLGYPNTSGLDTVDYRITDPYADTSGGTRYSEALLTMPESFLCFGAFDDVARVARSPVSHSGVVTFGSFNNIRKINPDTIAAWSEVLHRVPGSRFAIKSRRACEAVTKRNLLELFAQHGVNPERIELRSPTVARSDHLAAYNDIDIVLDTFPYHGTTTTCEALWMGVPVVTLAGATHAGRVSYSILENAGLPQLVTWSPVEFVERAAELANERTVLDTLRSDIAARIRGSILCDPIRFTRQLEALLVKTLEHTVDQNTTAAAG